MPGRLHSRKATPAVWDMQPVDRECRVQVGCTWVRAVGAASNRCCGAAVRHGAPGCSRPCNEGCLGEYI